MFSVTLIQINRLRVLNGVTVTVTRGAQSCELVAVPAVSKAQLVGGDGSFERVIVDDWIIVAADWTLTTPAYPAKGDVIAVDDTTKYLVAHPDDKTPVFANFNQLDRPAVAWTVHSIPR